MKIPNLYDVFYKLDFAFERIPEIEKEAGKFNTAFNNIIKDYDIPFKQADAIRNSHTETYTTAQYMGFVQGFKWAVSLFFGDY